MVGHIQWSLRSHGGAISSNSTLQQFPIRYFDFTPPGAHRQTLNRTVVFFNHWLMLRSRFQDRRAVNERNWERDCKITHTHMKKVFFVQKAHPPIKFLFSHLSGQAKCFGLTRKMPSVIPLKKRIHSPANVIPLPFTSFTFAPVEKRRQAGLTAFGYVQREQVWTRNMSCAPERCAWPRSQEKPWERGWGAWAGLKIKKSSSYT